MEAPSHRKYRVSKHGRAKAASAWTKWYDVNKKQLSERKREKYRKLDAHLKQKRCRVAALKHLYGISPEDYIDMHEAQHGLCAICQQPETGLNNTRTSARLLSVDHDHQTQQVRGLLCLKCNHALGCADDSILKLRSMIAYLETHNG